MAGRSPSPVTLKPESSFPQDIQHGFGPDPPDGILNCFVGGLLGRVMPFVIPIDVSQFSCRGIGVPGIRNTADDGVSNLFQPLACVMLNEINAIAIGIYLGPTGDGGLAYVDVTYSRVEGG